jgi:hypothetical protein
VNIHVLLIVGTEGRRRSSPAGYWYSSATVRGVENRRKRFELRQESGELRLVSGRDPASKKSSNYHKQLTPVPETDTGGMVENTKGREITLSKELGKIAP